MVGETLGGPQDEKEARKGVATLRIVLNLNMTA